MTALPIVHMEEITKVFRDGQTEARVLAGLDLDVYEGEYVLIEGPSGCGKSTLLAIMGLLDSPTSGLYSFRGQLVRDLSLADRARIRNQEVGFVFQSFNLIGDMSVYENVEQPLTYSKMKSSERKERVNQALEQVGIAHQSKRRPSQLSGGEQQRVAVARAIVTRPRILLADEPTGNLDSASGAAIMELLRSLHRAGTTVCMVTHDPHFVHLADRVVNMFDGKLVGETVQYGER
jgi:putative ABC transport system ATP-binding protein